MESRPTAHPAHATTPNATPPNANTPVATPPMAITPLARSPHGDNPFRHSFFSSGRIDPARDVNQRQSEPGRFGFVFKAEHALHRRRQFIERTANRFQLAL